MQRTAAAGYDSDFALWAEEQAASLREGRFADLDLANLIEEIDDLSNRKRDAIRSRLIILATHLLKWQYQPELASRSWRNTIREQSRRIARLLKDSPSLRREMRDFTLEAYADARAKASDETDLLLATFPETPTPEFERALKAALAGEDFAF
jgi:hypothetical protein